MFSCTIILLLCTLDLHYLMGYLFTIGCIFLRALALKYQPPRELYNGGDHETQLCDGTRGKDSLFPCIELSNSGLVYALSDCDAKCLPVCMLVHPPVCLLLICRPYSTFQR